MSPSRINKEPTDISQKAMESSENPGVAEANELNPKQQPRLQSGTSLGSEHIPPLIPIHRLAHVELLKLVKSVMKL